jgi:hypothetical protein
LTSEKSAQMDLNQISQKLLNLQQQINTLVSEIPDGYQVHFDIVDFSRNEDILPRERLLISLRPVDREALAIVIGKAKRL